MPKYLRFIQAYPPEEIAEEGWCLWNMAAVFSYYVKKTIQTNRLQKLMIGFRLTDINVANKYEVDEEPGGNICSVEAHIIPNNFLSGSIELHDRYRESFLYFKEAFNFVSTYYGLNQEAVESLYSVVIKNGFIFDELITQKKNKYHHVEFRWKLEQKLTFYIKCSGIGTREICICSMLCGYIEPKDFFGTPVLDGHKIIIPRTKTKDYWVVDLETGTVDFQFFRAENGDAHGQYDLAKMYLDGYLVDKDLEKATYWLEKAAGQNFKRAQAMLEKLSKVQD